MAVWTELVNEINQLRVEDRLSWFQRELPQALDRISSIRDQRNVIFYASAYLQKPGLKPQFTQLTAEELNGFMACMHGMDWGRGLTLVLHTPGGQTNATETIVQYLFSKFADIEVIVPTFAMSAGTMISLAAHRIIMGRQSQLGPIDPQMHAGGKFVSAQAIVDQFANAKAEISDNPILAHAWAPVLSSLGPALLVEAQNALDYGENMVAGWLAERMCVNDPSPVDTGKRIARYFNDAGKHKSHGRRIGRDEARQQGVVIEDLETDQLLQDAVLTAYHLLTIYFEMSSASKLIFNNHGQTWIKHAK